MNISPIMASQVQANKAVNFGCKEEKPLINIPGNAPDNQVAFYSTWGDNYAFPVTVGQLREMEAQKEANMKKMNEIQAKTAYEKGQETSEEYYARKINSTEWMM